MPEKPFCSNGATPGEKCDPEVPNVCGFTSYCSRYFSPAGDDSAGYVCCPLKPPIAINPFNVSTIF